MHGFFVASTLLAASFSSISAAPVASVYQPSDVTDILHDLRMPQTSQNTTVGESSPILGSDSGSSSTGSFGAAKRAVEQLFADILQPRTTRAENAKVEIPVEIRSILNEAPA